MTAIAFRDGILAVDRQVSWDTITTIAKKYHKVKIPGFGVCCVVMSGFVYGEEVIVDLLSQTAKGTGQDTGDMKAQARYGLIITKDLHVHGVYGDGRVGLREHHENKYFAEGSAFQFLMGAMAAGMGAESAVNLACTHCNGCGHGVDVVNVKEFLQYDDL